MVEKIGDGDIAAIAVYFVLILAVGLWATFRPNKGTATGYFLAGKTMHWFPVGASLFASNVGAPMFIGLAGTAAAGGFACAIYEWHAVYLLIALGWVFVPVYVAAGAFTMPEYLKKRFGGVRLRIVLSVLALVLYVLTKISSEIFAGAIFMRQMLGWNMYACIAIILGVTAFYTIAGGLAAVIYTDAVQTVILMIGAIILFAVSMVDIGGWNHFMESYKMSASAKTFADPVNLSCGLPRDDFDHLWRDPATADIPWTGSVFGLTPIGIWVWCSDQVMVQRCLAAKNMSHSKGGSIMAAALKITTFFLFIIPGMISRIFFPDEVACSDPDSCEEACDNKAGCSNIAYPLMVLRKMPEGIRGVMLAALMAALMSTLTSIFNSASSMFTMDIYRRIRKNPPQHELMIVGRLCVVALIALSILWIPIVEGSQGGQLWTYLQTISSCISPPWCWVFLLAIFWKGTTEPGAFWGLVISTAVGCVRMVLEFAYEAPLCGSGDEDPRPSILKDVHFLHFSIILSGITIVCTVGISLVTKPRPPEKLRRVTWWTRHDPLDPEETDSEDDFGEEEEEIDEEEAIQASLAKQRKKKTRAQRIWRPFYKWLCGVDDEPHPKLTAKEKLLIKKRMTDIREDPKITAITNTMAIVVAAACTFLLGFFA